jgi:hypothetical protein
VKTVAASLNRRFTSENFSISYQAYVLHFVRRNSQGGTGFSCDQMPRSAIRASCSSTPSDRLLEHLRNHQAKPGPHKQEQAEQLFLHGSPRGFPEMFGSAL